MPMLIARRPAFMNKPEYIERTDLIEGTRIITITSNRFKNEWFNTMFNNTFVNYFKNKMTMNKVLCCDIFLALEHGLKSRAWFLQQQKEMDELSFRMEILNETVGEVEGAYFSMEMFSKNQLLKQPYYPQTIEKYLSGTWKPFRAKYPDEIRMLFIDFAFAGGDKNDNTVIGCLSAYPKGDTWVRNVDYLETLDGGQGDIALLHIREYRIDYEADYVVFDLRNGGQVHYNTLTKEFDHPYRKPEDWNSRGLTVCEDMSLQVVSAESYKDLVSRTNDQDAIPCLIPISGSTTFNSTMWMELNHKLRLDELRFLIDVTDYEQTMGIDELNMTSEERVELKIPYLQTRLLINEAINLTATYRNGEVSLSEGTNPNATKDRIVSLGYGNIIMTKAINGIEKNRGNQEIDFSRYQLLY